jgi:MFS family permease
MVLFKKISQIRLMLLGVIAIGTGFLVLLLGHHYLFAVFGMIILTLGEMMFIPVSQNIIYQNADEELKGHYTGIYQAIFSIALVLSPLLGTFSLNFDPSGKFLWISAFLLCLMPLCIALLFFRKK